MSDATTLTDKMRELPEVMRKYHESQAMMIDAIDRLIAELNCVMDQVE